MTEMLYVFIDRKTVIDAVRPDCVSRENRLPRRRAPRNDPEILWNSVIVSDNTVDIFGREVRARQSIQDQ